MDQRSRKPKVATDPYFAHVAHFDAHALKAEAARQQQGVLLGTKFRKGEMPPSSADALRRFEVFLHSFATPCSQRWILG